MAKRCMCATWCLVACLVSLPLMSSPTEARRALTWPPKRDRETASWPASYASNRHRVVSVSSREDEDDDRDEPSCDELRAIWRLSKRAARESLLSNRIPPAHVPPDGGPLFGYMVRTPQVIPPNNRPPATGAVPQRQQLPYDPRGRPRSTFGRIVVDPAKSRSPQPVSAYGNGYDQVAKEMRDTGIFAENPARHVGMARPAYGRVSPVTPRPVAYGKNRAAYKNYVYAPATLPPSQATAARYKNGGWGVYKDSGIYKDPGIYKDSGVYKNPGAYKNPTAYKNPGTYKKPVVYEPKEPVVYATGRKPSPKSKHSSGAKNYGRYPETTTGFSTDTSSCRDIELKHCQQDSECACYGLYSCISSRCRTTSSPGNQASTKWRSGEIWHSGPLPSSELGAATPSVSTSSSYRRGNNNNDYVANNNNNNNNNNRHLKHWKQPVANIDDYGTDRFGTWS